tara:strand:+ start:246 stop:875 length:630 start_codon:yes stop_codon:yes gene_type:complete
MKIEKIPAATMGWLETKLDTEHVKWLWERIDEGGSDLKHQLAGNITTSFLIDDKDGWFFSNVLMKHVLAYRNANNGQDPIRNFALGQLELKLHDMWVNYQYQHEINPYHHHGGVYSFTIWLKIPYDCMEQNKLSHLNGCQEEYKKPGIFEFEFQDMLGEIRHFGYRLDQSFEGKMLFFPAALRHTVYPFYECEEPRISIAGNIWYKPTR